jgi:hypothetical protein
MSSEKKSRKRKPPPEIKVVYENECQEGVFERELIKILAKKIKNGTLAIETESETIKTTV